MGNLTVKEIMYLRELLKRDGVEIQKDLDSGADKGLCGNDLSANKSLQSKLNKHIEKNFY